MPKITPEFLLNSLVTYFSGALKQGTVKLTSTTGDGRNDSSIDETKVSQALQLYTQANENFAKYGVRIELGQARCWYDLLIVSDTHNIWLPVNVKVSSMKGQDNVSSKEGLFYALTGVNPSDVSLNTWPNYCEALAENLDPECGADYYFFVVSKTDIGNVFWNSLKQLSAVVPNGNNPPFQANWAKNKHRMKRNAFDSAQMLMNTLGDTFKLRADAWISFQEKLTPKVRSLVRKAKQANL